MTLHGNKTHYPDTKALFDFGFKNFKNVAISKLDENLKTDHYITSETVLKDFVGEDTDYSFEYDENAIVTMPNTASFSDFVPKLTDLHAEEYTLTANIKYYYGEDVMGVLPVTLKKKEPAPSPVENLGDPGSIVFLILKILGVIILVVLVAYVLLYIYAKNELKKRRRLRRRQHDDDEPERRRRPDHDRERNHRNHRDHNRERDRY